MFDKTNKKSILPFIIIFIIVYWLQHSNNLVLTCSSYGDCSIQKIHLSRMGSHRETLSRFSIADITDLSCKKNKCFVAITPKLSYDKHGRTPYQEKITPKMYKKLTEERNRFQNRNKNSINNF